MINNESMGKNVPNVKHPYTETISVDHENKWIVVTIQFETIKTLATTLFQKIDLCNSNLVALDGVDTVDNKKSSLQSVPASTIEYNPTGITRTHEFMSPNTIHLRITKKILYQIIESFENKTKFSFKEGGINQEKSGYGYTFQQHNIID